MKFLDYFEKRKRTYPQDVKGKFRQIKNFTNGICLSIFLLAPFLRFDRGVDLPNQAILIDIVNSRGYFFFIKIWPEEVYYLAAILIFAAILLFFITSLFGRVWCGYSCPQTVWTDIFIKVERLFQGDRNQRIILDRKNNLNKFCRKLATHIVWLSIGLITGIGFVTYFNDAFVVLKSIWQFNLSFNITCWILGIATMTYIMAGFAREQVCNYMCPYARFQSVMFDSNTMIISYDQKRGEPRAKYKKDQTMDDRGHCIDCKQCVVVCPQNIDIRNGLQMECIACGLCIDACDNVMEKLDLPKGLIRYDTELGIEQGKNSSIRSKILKPRTYFYSIIISLIAIFMCYKLTFSSKIDLKVIPSRNPLFVQLSNGDIRNGYDIKIYNKSNFDKDFSLKINNQNLIAIKVQNPKDLDLNQIKIKNDSIQNIKIYLKVKKENLTQIKLNNTIKFTIADLTNQEKKDINSIFMTP